MRLLEPKYTVPHISLLFTYNYKVKIFVKYAIPHGPHLNHALDAADNFYSAKHRHNPGQAEWRSIRLFQGTNILFVITS